MATTYIITIKTSDIKEAGTDANVYIVLSSLEADRNKAIRHVQLLDEPNRNDFESGKLDTFFVSSTYDIGDVNRILLFHDNSGKNPGWHIERVTVQKFSGWTASPFAGGQPIYGPVQTFNFGRWLAAGENNAPSWGTATRGGSLYQGVSCSAEEQPLGGWWGDSLEQMKSKF
jgi:lipoxygenase homology domain-containing protein 1